ncbi:MAG: TonB-dependent receptor, partial [Asticcacaulis sp.]|nr:TonB-dependent receptor [Asticcacaulis sp.]
MTVFSDRAARRLLLLSTTLAATGVALPVFAQDATTPDVSDKAVTTVIVKAEHSRAAANAPAKASVDATQPQSIISRPYIDLVVPETGDFTNVVNIAPSVSGTQGNGAGYGDAKLVLRGFQDGEYNVTYDGIPYGDTNDPTHHSNTFFPASTIGAVIVDRGPGAAGDLGQENYGGAIHMFSNKVQDEAGFTQKLSYGSFNSWQTVSVLQSGRLDGMGGLKVLLNVQERGTDGALSYFSLKSSNQSIKAELPLGDNWTVTALFTHNMNFSHQPDNDGATLAQVAQFGKNFYMNNDPATPQYYDYNRILKHTDFGYVRVNGDLGHGITLEDTVYTYFYSNHTFSALDVTGATLNGPKSKGGVIVVAGAGLGDVPGYDKLNHYTVNGNILRMNKAWSFGTLKAGGLIETSDTNRHRYDLDMNFQGQTGNMVRDPREKACPTCNPDDKSMQIEENSYWWQYQAFADFAWTPSDSLTVTPGVKYVNFTRAVSGKIKTKPLSFVNGYAKKKYDATLPFLTVNYKLAPNWSLYGQYAQGFQVPALSTLYVNQ